MAAEGCRCFEVGEFLPFLIAGIFILVIAYAAFSLPGTSTGGYLGNTGSNANKDLTFLGQNVIVSNSPYQLAEGSATVGKEGWMLTFNANPPDWQEGILEFTVMKHSDADLIFKLNGQEIYRGKASAGMHTVEFPIEVLQKQNVLEAGVDNLPWTDNGYSFDAKVYGSVFSGLNATFMTPATYKRAFLNVYFSRNEGRMHVFLDGNEIFGGQPSDILRLELSMTKGKSHTVSMAAEPGSHEFVDLAKVEFER